MPGRINKLLVGAGIDVEIKLNLVQNRKSYAMDGIRFFVEKIN